MSVMRRKRARLERTPKYRADEALGLALGRYCVADPNARLAVMAGFTLAVRENVAGRAPSTQAASRELVEAGVELARHAIAKLAADELAADPARASAQTTKRRRTRRRRT